MLDHEPAMNVQGRVEGVLRSLPAEEQLVLRRRFGIGVAVQDPDDLGQELGLSLSVVRAIESRALQRLRQGAMSNPIRQLGMSCMRQRGLPDPEEPTRPYAPEPAESDPCGGDPPERRREPSPYDVTAWDEA
jgi:hypothetical protein